MKTEFNILRYFAATSLISVVILASLLGLFYRHLALNDLLELAESKNISLTQAFSNSLWPKFAPFANSVSGLSGDELRDRPEIAKFRQAVVAMMVGVSVVKIKVYDLQGLTVFSTQLSQIGEDKSNNPGFLSARSGKVVSELTHRDTFSAFEQTIEDRDIIASYIPIRRGPSGPIEGVFELYYDVTPFLQKLGHTQRIVVIGVVFIFALLYGVLFIIVRRADRIIKRQEIESKQYLEEIKKANERLEERVQERTLDLSKINERLETEVSERKRAGERLQARYRELETLHAITRTILDSLDLKVMMGRILDQAVEIGGFDVGIIRLLDPTRDNLEAVAMRGYRDPRNVESHRKKVSDYTSGAGTVRVMADKSVHVVDLTQTAGMRTFKREGIRAIVAVPLRSHEDVFGVIHLGSRTSREFRESDLRILDAIGGQAGIAIQKARLYEESKRAQAALTEKAEALARLNAELQHFAEEVKFAKEKLERVNSVLTVQAADLARSNGELKQFAYIASHDLQEPLRMVAGYVQLLARRYKGKLDADADEYITFAAEGATRMQALINALLAYSRIGTKGKELEPTHCEKVLEAALKNLQMAIDESQAIVTHDPLPTVMGDATQLEQLFQNLIGNAVKFRGDKPPGVHVSAERNGEKWVFSFHDDGIGIDPQYAERIFVIFQRLHKKEEYPGTGIGLALCKKIVERHGGQIWVESEPGKGATFRFTMPL